METDTNRKGNTFARPALLVLALALALHLPAASQTTGNCERGAASADLDIGNVRARLFNNGGLFWIGGDPVYEVPRGSGIDAIFTTSFWIGGMVDGELRMAGSTYADREFWPGPLDEQGNPPADCSVYDRIFLVDRSDLVRLDETGEATADIRDWPWQLGAPVIDGDGNIDNYDIAGGDRPDILGDQMAWWVMNDAGNVHYWVETAPVPLEMQVSAFAFGRDDPVGNSTFYRLRLLYRGVKPWQDVFFGVYADADLGNGGDDYIGSDSLRGMGFFYNGDDFDEDRSQTSGYGSPPPALGFDILAGALGDADGVDNDHDGTVDESGERLQLTSMVHEANWYGHAENRYNQLQGRWQDGRTITYGGSGFAYSTVPTTFLFSGEPPEFWSQDQPTPGGTPYHPTNFDFILGSGPFDMSPADTVEIWLAIIWSIGGDRLDSVYRLKEDSDLIQTFFVEGMPPQPPIIPPVTPPTLLAPANYVLGQPINPVFRWDLISPISRYEFQLDDDRDFSSPIITETPFATTLEPVEDLPSNTRLFWRVRAINFAGIGPWSETWTFATGDVTVTGGRNGLLTIDGSTMFVEVAGPDDRYACGPLAESRFGCDEVGGNLLYSSYNGSREYVMWHIGAGPEASIAEFAPHDFEIRFTERGSYAVYPFGDDAQNNHIWVPFEIWDIGTTYTGTAENPNDPSDDVRLIPNLFGDSEPPGGGDDGRFAYGEAQSIFGLGIGATDRVYAYYVAEGGTYDDWEAIVKPNVDAAPAGVWNDSAGEQWDLIDFDRGRPIQRIVFDDAANGSAGDHPAFGVVVRFYTQDPIAPSVPIISAPLDGAADLAVPITLAWNSVGTSHRVQVSSGAAFPDTLVDATTPATFYRIESLPSPGTYYWRVNATDEGVTSDWSQVFSFNASVVVGTEDESTVPDRFALEPNYPNPFNPSTTIRFALPSAEHVTINVYDVIGRRIARLVDDVLPAGNHRAVWDADRHASGLYLYRMRAGNFTESRTMLLIR